MGNTSDSLKRNCDSIISILETLSIKGDMTHFVFFFNNVRIITHRLTSVHL